MNKQEYNLKDTVWVHLTGAALVKGRVVEIVEFSHLKENYPDIDYYIIEVSTGIDNTYEVRTWEEISSDAKGPINLYKGVNASSEKRVLAKIGIELPVQESAAVEVLALANNLKPKKRFYSKRKKNDA